jgi:hypothetical protein
MNIMRLLGLLLIVAGLVSIFAAVIVGNRVNFFIAALVLGIAGNVLYWLGKPKYTDEEASQNSSSNDEGPSDKPPAS